MACSRLAEEGLASILFDLPGHYLGNFSKVESFEQFTTEGPKLFSHALSALKNEINQKWTDSFETQIICGGHSLGALMALKGLELSEFNQYKNVLAILVGFGLPPEGMTHLFDTPFYKSTLNLRAQIVDPMIPPEKIFPWIKNQKMSLKTTGKRIHFITGEDDVVVGKDGSQRLADLLIELQNEVTLSKPARLPHHQPDMAAPHIKKWLKDNHYLD